MTQRPAASADKARMPPPTLSATSAYLVACWHALGLALIVADRSACWMREDGGLVAWVRVGRG